MNEAEFRRLYLGEFAPTPLPENGFKRVHDRDEAKEKAREYGLRREQWRYVSSEEQIHGIRLPNQERFYFIHWKIDRDLIKTRMIK